MSNTRIKINQTQKAATNGKENPKANLANGIVLAAATLIDGIAASVTLIPRMTVTISDPADPDDLFSPVTISNTGYILLNSVMPWVSIARMRTKGAPPGSEDFETYPAQTRKSADLSGLPAIWDWMTRSPSPLVSGEDC
jgi:hypothetical protein